MEYYVTTLSLLTIWYNARKPSRETFGNTTRKNPKEWYWHIRKKRQRAIVQKRKSFAKDRDACFVHGTGTLWKNAGLAEPRRNWQLKALQLYNLQPNQLYATDATPRADTQQMYGLRYQQKLGGINLYHSRKWHTKTDDGKKHLQSSRRRLSRFGRTSISDK